MELPATSVKRLVETPVDDEIHRRSGLRLDDLRIIDEQGSETPFVLFMLEGTRTTDTVPVTLHERSFTPNQYTQAVIEISGQAPFHNSLEIETPEQNFIDWERAPIFRFMKDGRDGTRVVHYSENNARYLRVRVLNGEKQFPIAGARVLHETSGPSERVPLAAPVTLDIHPPAGQSVWMADLGGEGIPVSEARFAVGPIEFIRRVNLFASHNNKNWNSVASGQIYRFHLGTKAQEQLSVSIPDRGASGRYWRVTVENGNDAPLGDAAVQLYKTPRHLVFEQQPGKSYALIYGQERAPAAEYDLGRRLDLKQQETATPGKLGPEEVNAAWVDPRPWTETHGVFLWGILVIAVIVIGFTAIQSMRRAAANADA
jgi:hypothetical protein